MPSKKLRAKVQPIFISERHSSVLALFHSQIVYVTGGQDLTVTSTAAASTLSNVRFEVGGFTNLVLDVPDLTMTGIYQSVSGAHIRTSLLVFQSHFVWLLGIDFRCPFCVGWFVYRRLPCRLPCYGAHGQLLHDLERNASA